MLGRSKGAAEAAPFCCSVPARIPSLDHLRVGDLSGLKPSLNAAVTFTASQPGLGEDQVRRWPCALERRTLLGNGPALPLSAIADAPADERFVLEINRSGVAARAAG
jgi:hypothetical protein